MPQPCSMLSLGMAFGLPLLLVLLWQDRGWKFIVLLLAILLNGWLLTISDVFAIVEAHNADVFERAYAGLPVTQDEFGQDGVGDRVVAMTFGWLVPLLGAAFGFVANAVRSRAFRARSEATPPSSPPAVANG